ncbi:MAG: hypothetical protein IPI67_01395 [Myxococcales bacterium]|nr:hypothetical protein [Myxococcales bacterium]
MERTWPLPMLLFVVACSSGGSSGSAAGGAAGNAASGGLGGTSGGGAGGSAATAGTTGSGGSSGTAGTAGSGGSAGAAGGGGSAGTGSGGSAGAAGSGGSAGAAGSGGSAGTGAGGAAGSGGTGGTSTYCKPELPTTITPGAPFAFIRPISTGYFDSMIESVREIPQQFAEAAVSVSHCAVLSATESTTAHARVAFASNGNASLTDKWDGSRVLGTQGSGVLAFDPNTLDVSLYATQDLGVAPVFTKNLNTAGPKAIKQGGFLAALWNGYSANPFVWGSISMSAQDKNGYLARVSASGAVQWAHQITGGSGFVLTVDDLGASLVQVTRSGGVPTPPSVTMNGTELIPAGADALNCTLAQVSSSGSVNWVKRVKSCSSDSIRWALSPNTQELYMTSIANIDWGGGPFSQSQVEHVLTKFDTSGKVAWQKSEVTFSNTILPAGYPRLIVADNGVPIVYGYLDKTISFGGATLTNQAGKHGIFIEAFETTGAPRWLSGFTDCNKVDSAWFSALARVHGKVALGAVLSSCTVNGTGFATAFTTPNLVVITP